MDEPTLLKSEYLLDLVGLVHDNPDEALVFCWPSGDDEPMGPQLMLQQRDWEELGKPSEITVTVVPGDHLNKEE